MHSKKTSANPSEVRFIINKAYKGVKECPKRIHLLELLNLQFIFTVCGARRPKSFLNPKCKSCIKTTQRPLKACVEQDIKDHKDRVQAQVVIVFLFGFIDMWGDPNL